jgi:hypothetical protein
MGAKEDALDALKEMGRHQAAGDHAGAVSAAEQLLRLVDELGDSRGREILRSTAASTWLTSKAVLDPGDVALPARCDDFYERFSALTFEGAATTAIVALGVKIQLLLRARQVEQATHVAEQLATFYRSRPPVGKLIEDQEIVRIASNMVAMGAPAAAAELLRTVVDQLSDASEPEALLLAATAQSWVVVALLFSGQAALDAPVPQSSEELRSLLDADDSPGLDRASEDTNKLIAMGDDAVQAGETIMQRLRHYGSHRDGARIMLSMITIAVYDETGQRDEFRAAEQAFIDEFLGHHDWRVDEVAHYYQRNLQQAQQ